MDGPFLQLPPSHPEIDDGLAKRVGGSNIHSVRDCLHHPMDVLTIKSLFV